MSCTVRVSRLFACVAAELALAALLGCGSSPSGANPASAKNARPALVAVPTTAASNNPGINLECEVDRIRKARAPFHWSYKKIVPPLTNTDWEADVTSLSIAGSVTDGSATRVIHGVRSDLTSWNTAVSILTSALPRSTFSFVNDSSAITRTGSENVNGQRGIKYTIDTSHDSAPDASLIRGVLGANGSIKGAAWVNAKGCPFKFLLDVEQYGRSGAVHKEHYEVDVTQQSRVQLP